jgi:hypothetical protein
MQVRKLQQGIGFEEPEMPTNRTPISFIKEFPSGLESTGEPMQFSSGKLAAHNTFEVLRLLGVGEG